MKVIGADYYYYYDLENDNIGRVMIIINFRITVDGRMIIHTGPSSLLTKFTTDDVLNCPSLVLQNLELLATQDAEAENEDLLPGTRVVLCYCLAEFVAHDVLLKELVDGLKVLEFVDVNILKTKTCCFDQSLFSNELVLSFLSVTDDFDYLYLMYASNLLVFFTIKISKSSTFS